MSLRSALGLAEPGVDEEPQQGLPIISLCWDPLFRFIRNLLTPKPGKAWTELGNLGAETSTEYKAVFESEVPDDFEGLLEDISLYSSRADTTQWELVIVEEVQFTDKKIYVPLTLNYAGKRIRAKKKIVVKAKTDGTATDIAASLTGELRYLGSK